jgi:hypothetical protein
MERMWVSAYQAISSWYLIANSVCTRTNLLHNTLASVDIPPPKWTDQQTIKNNRQAIHPLGASEVLDEAFSCSLTCMCDYCLLTIKRDCCGAATRPNDTARVNWHYSNVPHIMCSCDRGNLNSRLTVMRKRWAQWLRSPLIFLKWWAGVSKQSTGRQKLHGPFCCSDPI